VQQMEIINTIGYCLAPFMAIGIIFILFLFIGLLVDPESVFNWWDDITGFWSNKLEK